MDDAIEGYAATIRTAVGTGRPLCIRGGGTKDFYGGPLAGEVVDTRPLDGIVEYEPTELVLTARAGTPLVAIEEALATNGQMLAFEPPHFGPGATLGGSVAAGLSGPRRPAAGAVRDFVLGVRMLDGNGTDLQFGGRVMKNVAGFDVSRLLAGSLGTLGLLTEVSIKVLPRAPAERTLRFELAPEVAIRRVNEWGGQPLPVSASVIDGRELTIRLSGAESAVKAAAARLGGTDVPDADAWWHALREQTTAFFAGADPLWRLAVPSTAPPLPLAGGTLIEWGGAQRWLRPAPGVDAAQIRAAAAHAGCHATLFRASDKTVAVFTPLPDALVRIHRELKQSFDPKGVFNPGRLYPDM
jgi:glycolate oxidase FAD binding subunit